MNMQASAIEVGNAAQTGQALDPEVLRAFFPLDDVTPESLIIVAAHASVFEKAQKSVVVERGEEDDWVFYLLDGEVSLESADGNEIRIASSSDKARYPISTLRPHQYTVRALTPCRFVRLQRTLVDNLAKDHELDQENNYLVEELPADFDLWQYPLFQNIYQDLSDGTLNIPSLPEVGLKIQRMVARDEVDAHRLTKVIQTDPAIAAKLIKAANSPLYRGQVNVTTVSNAVVRLGMRTVSNLVMSFVMRDLYKTDSPLLKKRMVELWSHSTKVAAISYILAQMLDRFEPEQAMLAGLVHDIGIISILQAIEKYPSAAPESNELDAVITKLSGDVGAMILEKWGFGGEFIDVARDAENWYRNSGDTADYCDIVLIAQLHSFVGSPRIKTLPRMHDIPAFMKLPLGDLTPQMSLEILNQAEDRISRVQSWLRK